MVKNIITLSSQAYLNAIERN